MKEQGSVAPDPSSIGCMEFLFLMIDIYVLLFQSHSSNDHLGSALYGARCTQDTPAG
jgi:hypothetical protein